MPRAASFALASAFALTLGTTSACGSTDSRTPKPSTSAPPTTLTESDLHTRLLTVNDLPTGFTVDTDATDTNGTISSTDPHCKPLVDLMNSDGKPPTATAATNTSFTKSELGPNVATGLASFPSTQTAETLLTTISTAMKTCTTLTETDKDGSSYDFGVAALPFPETGDGSSATRMSADIGGYPAQVDIVVVRIGSTLLYVANTGLGGTDSGLTQDVVARAVGKVEGG
ncbi:hypothetical protein GCM10009839_20620 [Catenulispora yoronensis]|uniref:PknH-like extracellular domain-containing protein n=1 Tax=Catenulispora yoronensis TaxID=450799 RepID=A0ABP5FBD0_9ACTN